MRTILSKRNKFGNININACYSVAVFNKLLYLYNTILFKHELMDIIYKSIIL